MTAGAATHATVIAVNEPAEVAVGADFVLAVRVSCPAGCDLSGVADRSHGAGWRNRDRRSAVGDADTAERATSPSRRRSRSATIIWRLSCRGSRERRRASRSQPVAGGRCGPGRIETSLAVWSIPSPVVTGQPFAIKVGAKSTTGCDLTGMRIAVCDEAGAVLASGVLGDAPWPGTSALYWTELALVAPAEAGMFSWSVKFDAAELAVPHHGASSRFSIAIVNPPEHRLTVKVVEQETAAPIENAQVRLGAYRAATDGSGLAELMLPKGSYDLDVWKSGYEAPTTTIAIDADVTVEVAIAAVPEENPDAAWLM